MFRQHLFFVWTFAAIVGLVFTDHAVSADDYVLARSPWGNGSWGRNYGGMSNGYGGYYVRRNGYGNNYESRRPFTNPNGYIIPAQATQHPVAQPRYVQIVPAQPGSIVQPAVPTNQKR